jgi:hypothetical protein
MNFKPAIISVTEANLVVVCACNDLLFLLFLLFLYFCCFCCFFCFCCFCCLVNLSNPKLAHLNKMNITCWCQKEYEYLSYSMVHASMYQCHNVTMSQCKNIKIWKCKNVKIMSEWMNGVNEVNEVNEVNGGGTKQSSLSIFVWFLHTMWRIWHYFI